MHTVQQLEYRTVRSGRLDYLLFLPRGYEAKAGRRWPLILFLHGAGERGSDVWKAAKHGPASYVATEPDFPFIMVSPQCPAGQIWSRDVLLALLDAILREHRVDTGRVYLTGLSMGGYGTWDLGLAHPEKFAAIVPVCGGGQVMEVVLSSGEKGAALRNLGVWAFHGARDTVVPVHESQRMVDVLRQLGVREVKLTIYPEAGHDSWTQTYNNPALYDWLLQHERRK